MKKVIYLLVMVCFIVVSINTVFGFEEQENNTFEQTIKKELDFYQQNELMSDKGKIENIIRLFFLLKADQHTNLQNNDYDYSEFFYTNSKTMNHLNFMVDKIKLQKEIRKNNSTVVLWDNVTLDYRSVEIFDDKASIKVYVKYEFVLDEYENHISGTGTEYELKMQKYDNKWLIDDMLSKDSFDNELKDSGINVGKTINWMKTSPLYSKELLKNEISSPSNQNDSNLTLDWTSHSLDTSYVFSYALTYALNYNSRFPSYAGYGGDCQNFGSQCLWYGFGGDATDQQAISNHDWPMIDEDNSRDWYQGGTRYDTSNNWAWTGVIYFKNYLVNGGSGYDGPYGTIVNGIAYARKGDIIQVDWTGNGSYDHTFVVDSVVWSSTYGSRTMSDIYVSAHTTDVRRDLMSDLTFGADAVFRTLQITGLGEN